MAKFKIEHFQNQTATLRDLDTDECMHSSVGAWNEAQSLYILQSQLEKRLQSQEISPLVLYDIGLGVGANALAALQAWRGIPASSPRRSLHMISFEKFPEGMAFALNHCEDFPYLKRDFTLVKTLLEKGSAHLREAEGEVTWELHAGDWRSFIKNCPQPELIFFDLYSPKKCPELWGVDSFELLYERTQPRREVGQSTLLMTYSASTAVRAALLLAGFHVGYGATTSDKHDTTLASTQIKDLLHPLGEAWLEKWRRSSKPFPWGYSQKDQNSLDLKLSKLLEKNQNSVKPIS